MYDAAQCAADTVQPWTDLSPNATVVPNDTIAVPDPQPVPGSRFPERVQTRNTFHDQEVLRESLAQIPLKVKADIGYQAASLILDCEFAGTDCYLR